MAESFFSYHHNFLETLLYSTYYAPRGRPRLYSLGSILASRYIQASDQLIGVLGIEGSGKSTLIKGLFPGLELTNDDDGVNLRPTPIYDFRPDDYFAPHTFHLDVRYELAFKQPFEIIDAINNVIDAGRRVVIEHFDLIYKQLGYNAQLLVALGEEVLVARPTVLGPSPSDIKKIVENTVRYRKMAHSAEDITSHILAHDYAYKRKVLHSDVKHGFVIKFPDKPSFEIKELEGKIRDIINLDWKILQKGKDRISIGDWDMYCTGSRTHVKTTGEIEDFRLIKDFVFDPFWKEYMLVGIVGKKHQSGVEDMTYFDE